MLLEECIYRGLSLELGILLFHFLKLIAQTIYLLVPDVDFLGEGSILQLKALAEAIHDPLDNVIKHVVVLGELGPHL